MEPGDRWIELAEGDEFAGYRIERSLGRGGMGVLYLALDPGLERRVALKLIAPEAAADEVFARRFAEESKIAASIEHPNVVPIYAAGEENDIPFIAMRYVSGSDLGKRLSREGRLDPAEAVALIAQVGSGLDAIHAAGLVHRDVKPANVLLDGVGGEDHAYITDFGVARNVATESGLTQTGRFVGTLDYVAPEQISGGAVDARADVYALGCLVYKLLTGEVPFPRDGEAARLYAHLNDPPPAPSLQVTEASMALDDVVIRAMSKLPDDRYPSAGDLGRAAVAALSGSQPDLPERTVATGAAATRTAETVAIGSSRSEGAPTRRLRPRSGPPSAWIRGKGRPRLAVLAGAVAVVTAVLVGAIALSGGSGPTGGEGQAETLKPANRSDAKPEPLTEAELIRKGDAICRESQDAYKEIRDPVSEEVPDISYSEALLRISTRAVGKFRQLDPPPALSTAYGAYVTHQEAVKIWDANALHAARADDETAYLEARERRDETQPARHELAERIGFEVCSAK